MLTRPGDDRTRVWWKVNLQHDAEAKIVHLQFTSRSRSLPFSCLHLLNPGSAPTQPGNNLSCVSSQNLNDYKLAKLWNKLSFIFIMWTLKEQTHAKKKTYATRKSILYIETIMWPSVCLEMNQCHLPNQFTHLLFTFSYCIWGDNWKFE